MKLKGALILQILKYNNWRKSFRRTKIGLTSKMSLIDSMNVKLQTLSSEDKEAEKKLIN
jgi:hypothetical protein